MMNWSCLNSALRIIRVILGFNCVYACLCFLDFLRGRHYMSLVSLVFIIYRS